MTNRAETRWIQAALDYIPQWLGFQLEYQRQPGCSVAIAQGGKTVAEFALGAADLRTGTALTPRHRLRIASHSKTFTAAGVMLLREQGKLGLDDPIGRYVSGLHRDLAGARIGELLSHGAGVTRDGPDDGQFQDRRPYLSRDELRADLREKPPLPAGLQLKYSNHGYGLLGLMMEEVTGTDYASWMARHVVEPAGLAETAPDMPGLPKKAPMASGHSGEFPFGQRLIVPGDNVCSAMAPAAGFVSTASDVARFFSQLAPDSAQSILSPASRREMARRRWRDPCSLVESHYGLGTMLSAPGPREWAGHTGGLQGFISRTSRFPSLDLTVSVLTNAQDGLAYPWVDGIAGILFAFQQHGVPGRREASWAGRWWSIWGANDFVPMGRVVCQVAPAMPMPFHAATTELAVTGKDSAVLKKTSGYYSAGQPVRRVRDATGTPVELWTGGARLVPRDTLVAEATQRYRKAKPGRKGSTRAG